MQKYLIVTGANSFVGKHVKDWFTNNKHDFTVKYLNGSKDLDLTEKGATLDFFDDFTSTFDLRVQRMSSDEMHSFENKKLNVLHLAAVCGGIKANCDRPADFFTQNMQMGLNIFEAARIFKIDRLYTLGTTCSYPCYCPIPFREEDIWNGYPEVTNASYALAKKCLLQMHTAYRQQYGLKGAHLIPANMYGLYDHFNLGTSHVIPALILKFLNAKENNKPYVECWGTGNASRDFLNAKECARAIGLAITQNLDYEDPINVGSGEEICIRDLALMIKNLTGYQGDIKFVGGMDGQPRRRLDISRAKKVLGFENQISLRNGLTETIEYAKRVFA